MWRVFVLCLFFMRFSCMSSGRLKFLALLWGPWSGWFLAFSSIHVLRCPLVPVIGMAVLPEPMFLSAVLCVFWRPVDPSSDPSWLCSTLRILTKGWRAEGDLWLMSFSTWPLASPGHFVPGGGTLGSMKVSPSYNRSDLTWWSWRLGASSWCRWCGLLDGVALGFFFFFLSIGLGWEMPSKVVDIFFQSSSFKAPLRFDWRFLIEMCSVFILVRWYLHGPLLPVLLHRGRSRLGLLSFFLAGYWEDFALLGHLSVWRPDTSCCDAFSESSSHQKGLIFGSSFGFLPASSWDPGWTVDAGQVTPPERIPLPLD